ncbi:spermatogenesis-associated protein 17 [Antennarius striatus]|uniref:spermatogenesis-associated protein 17 n=1 Tax=Antennarius striatus TaxID=241820 RepID=UPI0035ADD2F1
MAELLELERELEELKKQHFHRHRQVEENRQKEIQAATRIQAWFRACRVRAHLSHLHKKAIIIQKMWRGVTARARVRQMVKARYFIMNMNFYDEMAVRIQRRWRGFFVRKNIHNFYAQKSYLEGLSGKNELLRRELDEFQELQKRERDCLQMVKEQKAKVLQAQRLHYLLSTKQRPGIFNSPFRPAPHEMEKVLRQFKYKAPTKLTHRASPCLLDPAFPHFPGTQGSSSVKTSRSFCSPRPILPPIGSKKQEGQTREPGEVWQQRVHYPDLMLRLRTSQTQLEEAQNQLQRHESV